MSKIITTSYDGPDLDGYGSAVAYAELLRAQGKDAEAHIWGEPQLEVRWLLETFHLTPAAGPISDPTVQVIFLDAATSEGLPNSLQTDQVVEIIDHHPLHNGAEFKNALLQIEFVGAAATLVAERFQLAGITPSRESALWLYGGILSNTQNFTAPVTIDRDKQMARWLQEISGAADDFAQRLFIAKSDLGGFKLQESLFSDSKMFTIQGKRIGTTQLEILKAKTLIQERRLEIEQFLQNMKTEQKCKYTFANIKDVENRISFIFCLDPQTQALFQSAPEIAWDGLLGESRLLTMRKQITPWIDQRLKDGYV